MINFGVTHQLAQSNVRDPVKLHNPLQFFTYDTEPASTPEPEPKPTKQKTPKQLTLFGIPANPGAFPTPRAPAAAPAPPPPTGPSPGQMPLFNPQPTAPPAAPPPASPAPPAAVPQSTGGLSSWWRGRRHGSPQPPPAMSPLEANAERMRRSDEEWAERSSWPAPPPLAHSQHGVTVADDGPGSVDLRASAQPRALPTRDQGSLWDPETPAPRYRSRISFGDDYHPHPRAATSYAQAPLFDPADPSTVHSEVKFSHAAAPAPQGRAGHAPLDVTHPPPLQMQQHGDVLWTRAAFTPPRTVELPRPVAVRRMDGWNTPARAVEPPRRAAPSHTPADHYQGATHEAYDTLDRNAPDIRTFPGYGKPPRTV